MSEEQFQPQPQEFECGMCGAPNRYGCDLCGGDNTRYRKSRSYTLSEERVGLNKDAQAKRYGSQGEVGPERTDANVVLPKRR